MKYIFIILSIVLINFFSCKTQETQQTTALETELITPCDCIEKQGDNNIICASAVGESKDQMFSKRKALSDARVELASLMKTYVLSISNRLSDSKNIGNIEDFEIKRQEATRQVVEQTLTDMQVTCEKVMVTNTGIYKTYVRIEMKKKAVDEKIGSNSFFKTFIAL